MNEVQAIKSKADIASIKRQLSGRNLLLFTIGINTALRISDILSLKAKDVSGDFIEIVEGKTGKRRRIKINSAIKSALSELLPADVSPSAYLFPSRKGEKPVGRVQAWRIINAAASKAGVNLQLGAHSLRKTFGYHAYTNGTDISLLMRVLNHSSAKETLRYIGIEQDNIDDVYIDACL